MSNAVLWMMVNRKLGGCQLILDGRNVPYSDQKK